MVFAVLRSVLRLGQLCRRRGDDHAHRAGSDVGADRGAELADEELDQTRNLLAQLRGEPVGAVGGSEMVHGDRDGTVVGGLDGVLHETVHRAGRGPHLLQRHDPPLAHVEHGLDRESRAQHGGGGADPAAALLGTALAVKPVLHVREGRVVPLEKVRTAARAVNRLVQLAVEAADDGPVAIAVHHLAAAERADRLAAELRHQVPDLVELFVSELGAAIGAHVGPGAMTTPTAPSPPQLTEPED